MQLGRALREVGGRAQGWQPTQRALHYAEIGENPETLARVQLGVAETHLVDGDAATALAICQTVLQQPDLKASLRRRALKIAGGVHYFRSELA